MSNPLKYKFTVESVVDQKFEDPTVRVVIRPDSGMDKETEKHFVHYLNTFLIVKELESGDNDYDRKFFYYSPVPENSSLKLTEIKFYIKRMEDFSHILEQFPDQSNFRPYFNKDAVVHSAGLDLMFHNKQELTDVIAHLLEDAVKSQDSKIKDKKDRFLVVDIEFNDLPEIIQFEKIATSPKLLPYHISLFPTRENTDFFERAGRFERINSYFDSEFQNIRKAIVRDFHKVNKKLSDIENTTDRIASFNKNFQVYSSKYFIGKAFPHPQYHNPAIHFAAGSPEKVLEFLNITKPDGKKVFKDVRFTYDGKLLDISLDFLSNSDNKEKMEDQIGVVFKDILEVKKNELISGVFSRPGNRKMKWQ